eukprot:708243-Pyramimonas_sp.AAC.1
MVLQKCFGDDDPEIADAVTDMNRDTVYTWRRASHVNLSPHVMVFQPMRCVVGEADSDRSDAWLEARPWVGSHKLAR